MAVPFKRPVDPGISDLMRKVRTRDTTPELMVRRELTFEGIHYRTHVRSLPGSPDIANKKGKWAIFVNGCFWHAHGCSRSRTPRSENRPAWEDKFRRNKARDAKAVALLKEMGYRVLTVWECECGSGVFLAARLLALVRGRP